MPHRATTSQGSNGGHGGRQQWACQWLAEERVPSPRSAFSPCTMFSALMKQKPSTPSCTTTRKGVHVLVHVVDIGTCMPKSTCMQDGATTSRPCSKCPRLACPRQEHWPDAHLRPVVQHPQDVLLCCGATAVEHLQRESRWGVGD